MSWIAALLVASTSAPLPIVAIDAGHGGNQHGATGVCGVLEKDVALAISTELSSVLLASGLATPYMVRTGDDDVELEERARRANAKGAAMFISVHANASTNNASRGVETYFLSNRASGRRISKLVARENRGIPLPAPVAGDILQQIVGGLLLSASHTEGQRFALRLQEGMHGNLDTRGRGVLQAPFIVLVGAQMPAALVEVGFLTHPEECELLAERSYQRDIAHSLAASILEHVANDRPALAKK